MSLRKIPGIGSGSRNAGDGQARSAGILERHGLRRAGGANCLGRERQAGG